MGWRPGYGIGPRVTYRQLTLQDQQASSLVEAIEETKEDEDEEANKHLYAPRDTKLILFRAKDNAFGLGYIPGQRLDEASREEIRKDPNISGAI
jgi:G patch domain-containing protein 1